MPRCRREGTHNGLSVMAAGHPGRVLKVDDGDNAARVFVPNVNRAQWISLDVVTRVNLPARHDADTVDSDSAAQTVPMVTLRMLAAMMMKIQRHRGFLWQHTRAPRCVAIQASLKAKEY